MSKKREVHGLTFDPDVFKKFKKKSEENGLKVSRRVELFMREYNTGIVSAITPTFVGEVKGILDERKGTSK